VFLSSVHHVLLSQRNCEKSILGFRSCGSMKRSSPGVTGARGHQVALKDHMSRPSACSEIAQRAGLTRDMHLIFLVAVLFKSHFVKPFAKICENLCKIPENLGKLPENTSKNGAQCALI